MYLVLGILTEHVQSLHSVDAALRRLGALLALMGSRAESP